MVTGSKSVCAGGESVTVADQRPLIKSDQKPRAQSAGRSGQAATPLARLRFANRRPLGFADWLGRPSGGCGSRKGRSESSLTRQEEAYAAKVAQAEAKAAAAAVAAAKAAKAQRDKEARVRVDAHYIRADAYSVRTDSIRTSVRNTCTPTSATHAHQRPQHMHTNVRKVSALALAKREGKRAMRPPTEGAGSRGRLSERERAFERERERGRLSERERAFERERERAFEREREGV
eukprot:685481-Prorocentrum_minimum.AAC.2